MAGLRADDYWGLHEAQNGCCALCGQSEDDGAGHLGVDRDRVTLQIRGLLCGSCKCQLLQTPMEPDVLRDIANYLERAWERFTDDCETCETQRWARADSSVGHGHSPLMIHEANGGWTVFAYQCENGHQWTCGWHSADLPMI